MDVLDLLDARTGQADMRLVCGDCSVAPRLFLSRLGEKRRAFRKAKVAIRFAEGM
jgi:hypothetical protein